VLLSVSALIALLAAPVRPTPADPALASLRNEITRIADDADGTVGVSIVHLPTGKSVSLRGTEPFPMASVFKLPVAVAVLRRVDAGKLKLDEALPVVKGDLRPRGPLFERFKPGMSVPVAELLDDMLVASDGSAADLLIRRLGGTKVVADELSGLGLKGIDVSLTELEIALLGAGVKEKPKDFRMTPEQLKKATENPSEKTRRHAQKAFETGKWNGATPEGLTTLLVRLDKGDLLSRASTDRILAAMRRCATGDRRIRAGVPKGTEVFDKTGTMGRTANDVGLVRLPGGGTLAVSVLIRSSFVGEKEREDVIARIAAAAFSAFSRGGAPTR
jgi:beta-lactamase class A